MDWPKRPDGSVDWMRIFQDPKDGFISLSQQADTSEKLRACFIRIVDILFTRRNDADDRQTNYNVVNDPFVDESNKPALSGLKVKLRMVMTRLMNVFYSHSVGSLPMLFQLGEHRCLIMPYGPVSADGELSVLENQLSS